MEFNKIGILGCGWLGSKIAAYFYKNNWKIFTFNSSIENKEKFQKLGYEAFQIDLYQENNDFHNFFNDFEALVISIPMSRNQSIEQLSQLFKSIGNLIQNTNASIFLCSSTGIYPQKMGYFNENSFFNEELNIKIFNLEQILIQKNNTINVLRLGGLMGDERIFSNYFETQESLEAVNHIHYQDIAMIIEQMILRKFQSKIYNVVAPIHPSKKSVFEYQKFKNSIPNTISESRIIGSKLLIKELDYSFLHPNPVYF